MKLTCLMLSLLAVANARTANAAEPAPEPRPQTRQTAASATADHFARKLLGATNSDFERLSQAADNGLLELTPVNLPTSPKGDNNHFGWPVATVADDMLIVVHRAMPGHNRKLSGSANADTTYSVIVRSTDGGRTWSEPFDLRTCMTNDDRNRGGSIPLSHRYKFDPDNHSPLGYKLHLNAIGTTRDGMVIVVSDHGAFRSKDKGRTWKHMRLAFREDHHDGPFVYVGPRIIDHPEHGLLLFAHHSIYRKGRPHDIARELAIYRSRDLGESWEKTTLGLPDWCKPAEPDVITHGNQFVAIVRNQAPANILAQLRFRFGDKTVDDIVNTNMNTRRSVDTSAVCFNPVTERYEVVQSKREDMSINLYSIAPEDWDTAKWRFEGRLFKRGGSFYSTADGFHTGGAVIDETRGVQHIFFYSGHPGGPAGVFRLTRTLDTPKLVKVLQPRSQPPTNRPHPLSNPTSWVMLAGDWVPDDPGTIDFDGLTRIPSRHAIISDVRDQGGIRVHQHAYLAHYQGRYWAMWSDGPGKRVPGFTPRQHRNVVPGHDQPGTRVSYSTSLDGLHWSDPADLSGPPRIDGFGWISRGLWVRDGQLLALASHFHAPGYAGKGLSLEAFRWNSNKDQWEALGTVMDDTLNNFPPKRLPSGPYMMTRRDRRRQVSVIIGGDKAFNDWSVRPLASYDGKGRPEEPYWYILPDGKNITGLIRDNGRSGRLLRTFSTDNGQTWTPITRTNFPDATSKFFVLRTSRGYYVMVSNSNPRRRDPLTLAVSRDGLVFDRLFYLVGGRHVDYPHIIEHKEHLLIAFSGAKQTMEVLKVSLDDLENVTP